MKTTFVTVIYSLLCIHLGLSQKTIIQNTNIVDVEKGTIIPSQHIVIEGASIASITSKKTKAGEVKLFFRVVLEIAESSIISSLVKHQQQIAMKTLTPPLTLIIFGERTSGGELKFLDQYPELRSQKIQTL